MFHLTVQAPHKSNIIIVIVNVTEYNANRSNTREARAITKNHRFL